MKLYSVTIRGIKYYFEAQISDEQYKLVNKMCETIQEESQKYCAEDIFSLYTALPLSQKRERIFFENFLFRYLCFDEEMSVVK